MSPTNAKPLERHNSSVDEQVADAGVCGQLHLPTGRTCVLPASHRGSCRFEPPEVARTVVRQAAAHEPRT